MRFEADTFGGWRYYALVSFHVDHDNRRNYYTVSFCDTCHNKDTDEFTTFADAEGYIRLIHSLEE
jgi:hypothetical protein